MRSTDPSPETTSPLLAKFLEAKGALETAKAELAALEDQARATRQRVQVYSRELANTQRTLERALDRSKTSPTQKTVPQPKPAEQLSRSYQRVLAVFSPGENLRFRQIQKQLPHVPEQTIRNVLSNAKKRGLLKSGGYGLYRLP